jgi:antibiotic biosynthesis monooxygenase (ABM) superfamily enzyme
VERPAGEAGPRTVVVTWRIRKGSEQAFEAWCREVSAAALGFPGHTGFDVLLPGIVEREYTIIFRFDSPDHMRAWLESDIRRELLKKTEPFRETEPSYRQESGLEYWFAPPGSPASPPRWKMAVVTVLGVWPVSLLVPWLLAPFVGGLPLPLKALFIAAGIVVLLTWAVMPVLVRILRPWLHRRT